MLSHQLFAGLAVMLTTVLAATELSTKSSNLTTQASKSLASNLMSYYQPDMNGLLPQPYYPWEGAGLWSTMIHYWHYTGDSQYNPNVFTGILAQASPTSDFMGSQTPGNDDQLWWGLTCMTAAEYHFPEGEGKWLSMAENVFSEIVARWDTTYCNGGGLHWQIVPSSNGYSYKNSITNGLAFQLAAWLARHTSQQKYLTWANRIFDWTLGVGYINNSTYSVYDGAHIDQNCKDNNTGQWSYNIGIFLSGSAIMLQQTNNSAKWTPHLNGFITALKRDFTSSSILQEYCESVGNCNDDQKSFKAYVARWLAETQVLVPSTKGDIGEILEASVKGPLGSCNGSPEKNSCGVKWTTGGFDAVVGVGQQMSALEVVQGQLAGKNKQKGGMEWVA